MPVDNCNSSNMLKPCLIIPIYNHSPEFERILPHLRSLGVKTLLINDGSELHHTDALIRMTKSDEQWLELISLSENSGKGKSVCIGLALAKEKGFSHALQIDADGQHQLNDIPLFLKEAAHYPDAVITAVRNYKNAPSSRVYGRKVTDFWVWVNTLSLHIKDSMCGFRVYPLDPVLHKLNLEKIRQRMDFDTDILVKIYWAGISIRQLSTDVEYCLDINSHFDVWKDNIRISLMHSSLFFGMLLRIPTLLRYRRTSHHDAKN